MGRWLALIGLLALPTVAAAQAGPDSTTAIGEVTELRVRQVTHRDGTLRVYFDARTAAGEAVDSLDAARLTATVGSMAAPVRAVRPFSPDEGVAYVLLVDVSRSLTPSDFDAVREALRAWVAGMNPADRLALVTFGSSVQTSQPFTGDAAALGAAIDGLRATDSQTYLYEAFQRAVEMSRQEGEGLPARRAVVVLSDGLDDAPGGVTREEVLRTLDESRVPIYAIGLARQGSAAGLESLGVIARASGGQLLRATSEPIGTLYAAVLTRIREALVAEVDCAACRFDGTPTRVQITLSEGGRRLTNGLDARLFPRAPDAAAPDSAATAPDGEATGTPWWMWAAGAAAVLLFGLMLVWLLRRRNRVEAGMEMPPDQEIAPPTDAVPAEELSAPATAMLPDAGRTVPLPPPPVEHETAPALKGPQWVRLSLTPMRTQAQARIVTLRDRALLGRAEGRADLAFPDDAAMSGEHALLKRQGEQAVLYDVGSTNGTLVNGVPIQGAYALRDDDVILMGNTELRVRLLGVG